MSDIPVTTNVDLMFYLPGAAASTQVSPRNLYGFELKTLTIKTPDGKTVYELMPYSNQVVDNTELGGSLPFDQLEIEAEYVYRGNWTTWHSNISAFANFIHGQKMQIVDISQPNYCYTGRCVSYEPEHESYFVSFIKCKWLCNPTRTTIYGHNALNFPLQEGSNVL